MSTQAKTHQDIIDLAKRVSLFSLCFSLPIHSSPFLFSFFLFFLLLFGSSFLPSAQNFTKAKLVCHLLSFDFSHLLTSSSLSLPRPDRSRRWFPGLHRRPLLQFHVLHANRPFLFLRPQPQSHPLSNAQLHLGSRFGSCDLRAQSRRSDQDVLSRSHRSHRP